MSDDPAPLNRSWLDRIGHALASEPRDRAELVAVLRDAQQRGVIDAEALTCMSAGASLINVSRGALVDEQALLAALQGGTIAGAGLDVYSREPVTRTDHPLSALYDMDNVILLPHLTFYTREAMQRLESETLERCYEVLEGRPVRILSRDPRLRSQTRGVSFD